MRIILVLSTLKNIENKHNIMNQMFRKKILLNLCQETVASLNRWVAVWAIGGVCIFYTTIGKGRKKFILKNRNSK